MGKKISRKCPLCGKEYLADVVRLRHGRQTTCSRECSYKLRANEITKTVKVTCPVCRKEFDARPSRIQRAKYTLVCSRRCLYEGRREGIIGREVKKPYSITKEGRKGWRESAKKRTGKLYKPPIKFACETCGKEVIIPRGKLSPSHRLRFCSQDCANIGNSGKGSPSWRGGYEAYYGPNWKRQRREARKRDKYTCQDCGITEKELNKQLDVHHIQRFANFSDYRKANCLENLVTVCHSCHMKRENNLNSH